METGWGCWSPMATRRRWSSRTTPVNNAQSSELVDSYFSYFLFFPASSPVSTLVSSRAGARVLVQSASGSECAVFSADAKGCVLVVTLRRVLACRCFGSALLQRADVPIRHQAGDKDNVRRRKKLIALVIPAWGWTANRARGRLARVHVDLLRECFVGWAQQNWVRKRTKTHSREARTKI